MKPGGKLVSITLLLVLLVNPVLPVLGYTISTTSKQVLKYDMYGVSVSPGDTFYPRYLYWKLNGGSLSFNTANSYTLGLNWYPETYGGTVYQSNTTAVALVSQVTPLGQVERYAVQPPPSKVYNVTAILPDGRVLTQENVEIAPGTILAPHLYDWYFDGVDDYLQISGSNTFDFKKQFGVAIWLRTLGIEGQYGSAIIGKGFVGLGAFSWAVYYDASGTVHTTVRTYDTVSHYYTVTSDVLSLDAPYTVISSYNGSVLTLNIPEVGDDINTTASGYMPNKYGPWLLIGSPFSNSHYSYYHGYVSSAVIWKSEIMSYTIYIQKHLIIDKNAIFSFVDASFYNGSIYLDLSEEDHNAIPYNGVSRVPANSTWLWVIQGYPSPWLEFRWFPVGSNITLTDSQGHTYTYRITDQPWLHATGPGKQPPTTPSGTLQDLPVAPPDPGTYNITVRLPDGTVLRQENAPITGGTILAPHLYDWQFDGTGYVLYDFPDKILPWNTTTTLNVRARIINASFNSDNKYFLSIFKYMTIRATYGSYPEIGWYMFWTNGTNSYGSFKNWNSTTYNVNMYSWNYYSVVYNITHIYEIINKTLKTYVTVNDAYLSTYGYYETHNYTIIGSWTTSYGFINGTMSYAIIKLNDTTIYQTPVMNKPPNLLFDPTFYNGIVYFNLVNQSITGTPYGGVSRVLADTKWLWVVEDATSDGLLHLDWFPIGTQVMLTGGGRTYRYVVLPTDYLSDSQVRSDALYAPPGTYNITVKLPEPWGWTLQQENVDLTPGTIIAPHMTTWSFDGVDDYIDVDYHPNLNLVSVEILFSATLVGDGNAHDIMTYGKDNYDHSMRMRIEPDGSLDFAVNPDADANSGFYSLSYYPDVGRWHHATDTWDGANVYLYVDGNLVGYNPTSSGYIDSPYDILIGKHPVAGYWFKGYIAFTHIYSRTLSGDEINASYLNHIVNASGMVLFLDPTFYNGTTYLDLSPYHNDGIPYGGVSRVWDGSQWLWVVQGGRNDSLIHLDWLPAGSVVTLESPGYRKQVVVGEEDRWLPTEQSWHTDNITVTPTGFLTVSTGYGTVALPSTASDTVSLFQGVHGLLDHLTYNDTTGVNTLFRPEFQGSTGYTDLYGKITLTVSGSIDRDQYENFTVGTWHTENSSVLINYFTTGSTIQFYSVFGETKVITLGQFETVDLHPGTYDVHFEMPLTPGEKPLTRSDYYAVVYGGAVLSSTGTVNNGFISYANRNAVYTLNPPVKGCVEFYLNGTVLGGGVLTVYNESLVFTYNKTSGLLSFSTALNTANESGSWNVTVENLTLLMVDTSLNTLYLYAYNYTWIELGGWPLTGGEIASITLTGEGYFVFTRSSVVKATVPTGGVLEINGYDALGYPLHLRVQDNGPGDYDVTDGQVTMLLLAAYPIDAVVSVYAPQTEVAAIMPAVINTPLPSVTVTPAGFPSSNWDEKPNMSYFITDWNRWSAVIVVFTSAVISLVVPPALAPFAGLMFLSGVGIGQAAGWVDLSPRVYGLAALMIVFALLYRRQSMQVA